VLTGASPARTCAPDGLVTMMATYVPATVGAGVTVPNTEIDCAPE